MSSYNPDHLFLANDSTKELVFIHGFLGEPDDWLPVIQPLQKDYTILALSLYQLIEPLENVTFEAVCGRIKEALDHYGLDKPVLIGYSLGGRIAIDYALRFPDQLAGLLIESAHLGFRVDDATDRSQYLALFKSRLDLLTDLDLKAFISQWYQQGLFSLTAKALTAEQLLQKIRLPKDALLALFKGLDLTQQGYLLANSDQFAFRIGYVVGSLDPKYVSLAQVVAANDAFQTDIVPGADHNVHLTQRDRFMSALHAYLADVF